MRTLRIAAAALPLALAACGSDQNAAPFQDATPSYAALAMDVTGPAAADGTAAGPALALAPAPIDALAMTPVDCHPHLFVRTADLARRVNRHLWKFLRHVEVMAARHPDHLDSGSARWQRGHGRIEVRWTVTKVSDQVFQWLLQARSAVHPDWATIFSGQIDRSGAKGPHQGAGTATLDLDALKAVDPLERASGVVVASFESFADHRKLVVDAKAVAWDTEGLSFFVSTPADAHYVYFREPGKGGSFKAHDAMAFLCPPPVSGPPPAADVKVLARWFVTGNEVHGRSDALMVGGQLPAGNAVMGLTCHQAALTADAQLEGYWMMKQEDAGGATVAAWTPAGATTACDTTFGPVPSASSAATDFDFAAVDFDSAAPGPFPGGP